MTASKSLPARPSLESLRKQAKKLARESQPPLSHREAQLLLAREYGFAGWQDLTAEVLKRTGEGLNWAIEQAQRAIHDNDVRRLKELLAEYPALISWQDDRDASLLAATTAWAMDVSDPAREEQFYRPACAEVLIDAGASIQRSWLQRILNTGGAGMLRLLQRKSALPRTLPFFAALGDLDAVRASTGDDLNTVNEAFMCACRFKHKEVASILLDRSIAIDPTFGTEIDRWRDRAAFIDFLSEYNVQLGKTTPWRAFVEREVVRATREGDMPAFKRWLDGQPWILDADSIDFQVQELEQATLEGRGDFILELLERDPAILHRSPPAQSDALGFAFAYGHSEVVPLLARVWSVPDDLPHAAGSGDLARVRRWFDASGKPALGDLKHHFPANRPRNMKNLYWGSAAPEQQVLDTALAWACMNHKFEVAAFLLEHGADINTRWATHEPASILHEFAVRHDLEGARFLIDHGIDLTIRDFRWNATAAGWAYVAAKDPEMGDLLVKAGAEW
jgi:hypothetical protein